MATILYERDADPAALAGQRITVVGYGNQGRSWALNLRDAGLEVQVCVRADATAAQAAADGFATGPLDDAGDAEVACYLVPDDVIPTLPLPERPDALTVVASGYTPAFGRIDPPGDVAMVAPRMLGPEVRRCYEEGVGFITAVGVHKDRTGTARARMLALAAAIGGLRQGAIKITPMQEALLDLRIEQILAPALAHVHQSFIQVMLEAGVPLEAVLAELVLSGEVERTMRLTRLEGYAAQMEHHSPTSQYGQLSRAERYQAFDLLPVMRASVEEIRSGRFADEWDAEREAGHPRLAALRRAAVGAEVRAFEAEVRARLGELVARNGPPPIDPPPTDPGTSTR